MIKIQIKSVIGKVLFEYEKENNTIKETLIQAVKEDAYLRGAYLGGANLRGAYLEGANLGGANLRGAYLGGANLRYANLRGANLGGANLRGANLGGADLEGADLEGANLGGANLRGAYLGGANLIQIVGIGSLGRCTTYDIKNDKIICGCFYGSLEEFENQVKETHGENEYAKQYLGWIEYLRNVIIKK